MSEAGPEIVGIAVNGSVRRIGVLDCTGLTGLTERQVNSRVKGHLKGIFLIGGLIAVEVHRITLKGIERTVFNRRFEYRNGIGQRDSAYMVVLIADIVEILIVSRHVSESKHQILTLFRHLYLVGSDGRSDLVVYRVIDRSAVEIKGLCDTITAFYGSRTEEEMNQQVLCRSGKMRIATFSGIVIIVIYRRACLHLIIRTARTVLYAQLRFPTCPTELDILVGTDGTKEHGLPTGDDVVVDI